jgi:chorismate mutase / prephenate dehydratase
MKSLATLGPVASDSYRAARRYLPEGEIVLFSRIADVVTAYLEGRVNLALIPVYNTREGEVKEYFRLVSKMAKGHWIDNLVLPIHLSLGTLTGSSTDETPITTIVGRNSVFRQCDEFIDSHYPHATLMAVHDIEAAMNTIRKEGRYDHSVIDSEELLVRHGFSLLAREVVSHNRTRFAVIGDQLLESSGFDATALMTRPLRDRVGLLADILGEFTRRGINILDLQSENDIKTQKLQIYVEVEGHQQDEQLQKALNTIEHAVIHEPGAVQILGSYPRVEMRVKQIKSFGFIGSGDMSKWFAERLHNEGYKTLICGRSTPLTPERMIEQVDVVMVCVPISVTAATIKQYGPLLQSGQALIILAGESENTIAAALAATHEGVEVMFVHNLWGPQALTMKDKNASVVRTHRSGPFSSEFEAFLYKHGADIFHDSAVRHDLLMGIGQKLPTTISVALAKTLRDFSINCDDIGSHSTLTSLYGILAMARVHNQNPRTYAEIMAASGEGRKIVRSFAANLLHLIDLAEQGDIAELTQIMESNRRFLPNTFLARQMKQAKAVDDVINNPSMKG